MRAGVWLLSAAFSMALVAPIGRGSLASGKPRIQGPWFPRSQIGWSTSTSANAALERFQDKLAELATIRDTGNSHDLHQAIAWLQEHTKVMQKLNLPEAAVRGYLLTGEIHAVLSQYQMARASYLRALHLSPQVGYLSCSSMSHLARVYATTGDWQTAFNYSQKAIKSGAGLNCWAEALQAEAEASFYSNEHDDLDHSLDLSLLAASVFVYLGDADREAQSLLTAAYSAFQLSRAQDGLHLAGQALGIWSSIGNRHGMALAHTALGCFFIRRSDPEGSRSESKQALNVFTGMGDRDNEAVVYGNLGSLAKEIGNLEEAYEDFEHSRLLFATVHDLIGEAGAVDSQADLMSSQHKYAQARLLYLSELALSRRARHARLEAAAYLGLADIFEARGNDQQAFSYSRLALAAEQAAHDDYGIGESWRSLGRLYAKHERKKDALTAFNHALDLKIFAEASYEEAAVRHEIAGVYQQMGQLESARAEIEKAIRLIEFERTRVAGFDDRASYFANVHKYYELYVDVLMQLHEQHPDRGFAQQAFEAWEKGKMRSLLDMLASGGQNANCSQQAQLSASPAVHTVSANACIAAEALKLGEIQEQIRGDNSVIVEYALGTKAGYIWVVDDRQMWSFKIANAGDVQALIDNFETTLLALLKPLRVPARAQPLQKAGEDCPQACESLAQILLKPIAHLLSGKRVIIVADGPLQHLPFSVLLFPSTDGQAALLRDHNELVYLPSASALKFIRHAADGRPRPKMQVVVYADPVFSRDDLQLSSGRNSIAKLEYPLELRRVMRDVNLNGGRLPRLPGTADEAQAIVEIMGSDGVSVTTGTKATREAVLNGNLGNYRHILFATHSFLDEKSPELSGLVFSLVNEAGAKLDGYLRVRDIYQLQLAAEMVVLSSCESALGRNLNSEGMIGLTRAFFYAGSKRVVSSLWKVDDEATAALIRYFYKQIHDGKGPGEALRLAQRALANDPQHPRWRHPYFWAGFILQGDYRPIESQH